MFSTEEAPEIAKAAEAESSAKKPGGRPRKRPIKGTLGDKEEEEPENPYSDSDSDCIVIAVRK